MWGRVQPGAHVQAPGRPPPSRHGTGAALCLCDCLSARVFEFLLVNKCRTGTKLGRGVQGSRGPRPPLLAAGLPRLFSARTEACPWTFAEPYCDRQRRDSGMFFVGWVVTCTWWYAYIRECHTAHRGADPGTGGHRPDLGVIPPTEKGRLRHAPHEPVCATCL